LLDWVSGWLGQVHLTLDIGQLTFDNEEPGPESRKEPSA
jgi:hypothetical protein